MPSARETISAAAVPAVPHAIGASELGQQLGTDLQAGLSPESAISRLQEYGPNTLELQAPEPWWRLLIRQLHNLMVYVLLLAAILAFVYNEHLEGVAIMLVILINTIIGFYMEWQANRSMEALQRMTHPLARVIRQGKLTEVDAAELVPGDLLSLEAGDVVAADARLVHVSNVELAEAALTGESLPVAKHTRPVPSGQILADRTNMVYRGTVVARGNGLGLITATGLHTELGKIATLTRSATQEATPLEKKLGILSQKLIGLTLVLALLTFLVGYIQEVPVYELVKITTALAVAAIPEGLPIIATIALARGMLRLARHRVIVKRLSAVETLGETQVIVTDKTGTLTENRLQVRKVRLPESEFLHDQGSIRGREVSSRSFSYLITAAALCNNASREGKDGGVGDPLEVALLHFADRYGTGQAELQLHYPRLAEQPFDSETRMMATLHRDPEGEHLLFVKGALEAVLTRSAWTLDAEGRKQPIDPSFWQKEENRIAAEGLRPLAFACATGVSGLPEAATGLTFLGLVGFWDAPRPEVPAALDQCRQAGIRVIMATGDHPQTARSIALATRLVGPEEALVQRGTDLQQEGEQPPIAQIYARVEPRQKMILIDRLQQAGQIVGMTGDGVNDAPALKKADIGIAMGRRGTEAAREAADLVLEDDSFASIVLAIRQGRGIMRNIRYFVIYLLSCNLSELIVVSGAFFFGLGTPLLPLQILFLNMVTDVFPALALGFTREDEQIMHRPPKPAREPIISRASWWAIIFYAATMTITLIFLYIFSSRQPDYTEVQMNNLIFLTLILIQLWHVFNLPSGRASFLSNEITRNRYVWYAVALCLLLTWGAFETGPVARVLHLEQLTASSIGLALVFSLVPTAIIRIGKWLSIRFFSRRSAGSAWRNHYSCTL